MALKMVTYTICGFGLPFVSANRSAKAAPCVQRRITWAALFRLKAEAGRRSEASALCR